jgi:hypothetical protein
MKLGVEPNADSLALLGAQAVDLLCRGDIDTLARQYGYALSFGRDTATAIRDDLQHCLSQVGATALASTPERPVRAVNFYNPEGWNVVAVVECLAPTQNGHTVLVELVVTRAGQEMHITLEQVSVPSGLRP